MPVVKRTCWVKSVNIAICLLVISQLMFKVSAFSWDAHRMLWGELCKNGRTDRELAVDSSSTGLQQPSVRYKTGVQSPFFRREGTLERDMCTRKQNCAVRHVVQAISTTRRCDLFSYHFGPEFILLTLTVFLGGGEIPFPPFPPPLSSRPFYK